MNKTSTSKVATNGILYGAIISALLAAATGCEDAKTTDELNQLEGERDTERRDAIDAAIEFDVSEDMTRFVFADAPVFDDGLPAFGNPFITQGYIYPAGYLDEHDGANAKGEPVSPKAVLGEWTCRGYMIGDGAHTESGPMVITTQFWNFYDEPGYASGKASRGSLVNEGLESAEVDVPWQRPVTGGAGDYAGASGQATQRFLGLNASEGFNLRVQFELDD
jgi:hypothetical protein